MRELLESRMQKFQDIIFYENERIRKFSNLY